MLDPRGNDRRGSQALSTGTGFSQDYKDFLLADPSPPGYIQTVYNKNTVKELLMMRRREQTGACSEDDNSSQHKFKSSKLEDFAGDVSPHQFGPPAQVIPSPTTPCPPGAPQGAYKTPQLLQYPNGHAALHGHEVVKKSLFHWQIQQEAQKVEGLSPEVLSNQDADGDTFLHIAVAQGKRALAYVLAAKMAGCGSLDTKEHNGQTALQIAATTNQHLIIHDLLQLGAQINTRDRWGRSPLHVCAEKGHFVSLQSIWRCPTWSGQPVDVEIVNYDGLTPLHAAVLSHNVAVKEIRSLESCSCPHMMLELLQRKHMYVECIKTLLLMGASYWTKDQKSGRTCLHMASEEANVELFSIFLELPGSLSTINVKTFSGHTALHIVSSLRSHKTQVKAVKLLMRRGADPGSRNFENELPSQLVPEGPVGEKVRQILKGRHVYT